MTIPHDGLPPIHPGVLLDEELKAIGWSRRRFAAHIRVPAGALLMILNGKRAITAQIALRLSRAFDTTPMYWLNLQTSYDLKRAGLEMPPLGIAPVAA